MKNLYKYINESIDKSVAIIDDNKEDILKNANIKFKKVGRVSRFGDNKYECFTIKYLNTSNVWWTYNFTVTKVEKFMLMNGYKYDDFAAGLLKK